MNWLPIESAPTNKLVILYWPASGEARGHRGHVLPEMIRVDYAGMTPNRLPTHWMPLPESPK